MERIQPTKTRSRYPIASRSPTPPELVSQFPCPGLRRASHGRDRAPLRAPAPTAACGPWPGRREASREHGALPGHSDIPRAAPGASGTGRTHPPLMELRPGTADRRGQGDTGTVRAPQPGQDEPHGAAELGGAPWLCSHRAPAPPARRKDEERGRGTPKPRGGAEDQTRCPPAGTPRDTPRSPRARGTPSPVRGRRVRAVPRVPRGRGRKGQRLHGPS